MLLQANSLHKKIKVNWVWVDCTTAVLNLFWTAYNHKWSRLLLWRYKMQFLYSLIKYSTVVAKIEWNKSNKGFWLFLILEKNFICWLHWIYLFVCLFGYLFVCLFIWIFGCLFVCLFARPVITGCLSSLG